MYYIYGTAGLHLVRDWPSDMSSAGAVDKYNTTWWTGVEDHTASHSTGGGEGGGLGSLAYLDSSRSTALAILGCLAAIDHDWLGLRSESQDRYRKRQQVRHPHPHPSVGFGLLCCVKRRGATKWLSKKGTRS